MIDLEKDKRIGRAGKYRYCRRCGCLFSSRLEASFHFEFKRSSGTAKCTGIPVGRPAAHPAPGVRNPSLEHYDQVG